MEASRRWEEPPDAPGRSAAESSAQIAWRLVGKREHAIAALVELSRELAVTVDLHGKVDVLLYNVMGQLGTARGALWMLVDGAASSAVLVRSHGFRRPMMQAIGTLLTPGRLRQLAAQRGALEARALGETLEPGERTLLEQAGIVLVATLWGPDDVLGLLALGGRVDGQAYEMVDLQGLQAALGMIGVFLLNIRLYSQMLESNRRLRQSNEDLKDLDRLKSEFLSNVNHELRTPLAIVLASIQCEIESRPQGQPASEMLQMAADSALKLKSLVENLLLFSESVREPRDLELTVGDVATVLRDYHAERLPGVSAELREFTFTSEPPPLPARCDRGRLVRIVGELVDNAVKFTPPGTHLRMSVARESLEGERWVRVDVADDGPGIAPDHLESLFKSFEQVDGSTTRKVGGLGLGLALAHRLAAQMDARLSAHSTLGQGITFTLRLRAADAA